MRRVQPGKSGPSVRAYRGGSGRMAGDRQAHREPSDDDIGLRDCTFTEMSTVDATKDVSEDTPIIDTWHPWVA
ncbi:MAG: hypothetical protein CMN25_06520 [Salinicola sp.]|nr:hypothetical protein [Salinicola sp.]